MAKRKLVVVGNGMAGAKAVENVLARGGASLFDIIVFGGEPYGNYNRIMLSSILNGKQGADDILINPLPWYEANGVTLHAGQRVTEIDRAAKVVASESGLHQPYDILLIATGSRAFIPPFKGAFTSDGSLKPGLFGYRTLDDCHAISAWAAHSRTAITVGGGLLGLEAARALMGLGCDSHIVHLAGHLLDVQLDATGGGLLRTTMEAMGLHVHTGKATTEVLGDGKVEGLAFKDGSTLACDMVVVAAGIRPNAEIGVRAGLTVERAIVVNDHMQSVDDMNVYAVGECAQHRGRVYGLVAPLFEQAKVFAEHVTERNRTAAYHGSKLATKLKVMGVELASMGITEPTEDHDEVIQFSEPKRGLYKKLIIRNGRLVGGILMGEISKAAYLMQAYDRDSPLPDERLALLFDLGEAPAIVSVGDLPPETQICNCNSVSKAAIGASVAGGCVNLKAVMDRTRAGTGCGSCKAQVEALVTWFSTKTPAIFNLSDGPGADTALVAAVQASGSVSFAPDRDGGQCSPAHLLRIAEIALRFNAESIELVGPNRIELIGLPPADIDKIRAEFSASPV